MSLPLYTSFLGLLGLERLVELALSRRNARWARASGGVEYGRAHLVWMKLLHAGWFAGCLAEAWLQSRPFYPWLGWPMLVLACLAQALRYWAITTLGRRWNIAVIVVPGWASEAGGPYRLLRHPNYLAVVVEGLAVPLMHSAYVTALVFTLLNAGLLVVRIRCEEAALAAHCGYHASLLDRPRLWPRVFRRSGQGSARLS